MCTDVPLATGGHCRKNTRLRSQSQQAVGVSQIDSSTKNRIKKGFKDHEAQKTLLRRLYNNFNLIWQWVLAIRMR